MSDMDGAGRPADLFDQWLAHHEGRPEGAPAEPAEEQAVDEHRTSGPVVDGTDADVTMLDAESQPEPEPVPRPESVPGPVLDDQPSGDHNVAAARVLAALHADEQATEPEPSTVAAAEAEAEPIAEVAQPTPVRAAHEAVVTPAGPATPAPHPAKALPQTIFFKPRADTQRILGLLLLVLLALTAGAAWWAWQDRGAISVAIAAIVALTTAIVWATRTSATPTHLTLHGSELEIVRGGSRALFDLAHTQVEVRGRPGARGWRVLLLRRSMGPYVIDSSMVDAREFTYVLRFFHPEV